MEVLGMEWNGGWTMEQNRVVHPILNSRSIPLSNPHSVPLNNPHLVQPPFRSTDQLPTVQPIPLMYSHSVPQELAGLIPDVATRVQELPTYTGSRESTRILYSCRSQLEQLEPPEYGSSAGEGSCPAFSISPPSPPPSSSLSPSSLRLSLLVSSLP